MAWDTQSPSENEPENVRLARRLLRGITGPSYVHEPTKSRVDVRDVEADIQIVREGVRVSRKLGLKMHLGVYDHGKVVPVGIDTWGEPFYTDDPKQLFTNWMNASQRLGKITEIEIGDLEELMVGPVAEFLKIRLDEDIEIPPTLSTPSNPSPPLSLGASATMNRGLAIEVITPQSGLRILYSRAYLISFSNVLGGPTSPVPLRGWILPGRYKFGADDSSNFYVDMRNFNIPPQFWVPLVLRRV